MKILDIIYEEIIKNSEWVGRKEFTLNTSPHLYEILKDEVVEIARMAYSGFNKPLTKDFTLHTYVYPKGIKLTINISLQNGYNIIWSYQE